MIEIRPARLDDIRHFSNVPLERTIRAMVVELDGEPVAIAGVTLCGGFVEAFCDVKPGLDVPKRTVWRYAKDLKDRIAAFRLPVVALADPGKKNACKFLESLGFVYAGQVENHAMYRM